MAKSLPYRYRELLKKKLPFEEKYLFELGEEIFPEKLKVHIEEASFEIIEDAKSNLLVVSESLAEVYSFSKFKDIIHPFNGFVLVSFSFRDFYKYFIISLNASLQNQSLLNRNIVFSSDFMRVNGSKNYSLSTQLKIKSLESDIDFLSKFLLKRKSSKSLGGRSLHEISLKEFVLQTEKDFLYLACSKITYAGNLSKAVIGRSLFVWFPKDEIFEARVYLFRHLMEILHKEFFLSVEVNILY